MNPTLNQLVIHLMPVGSCAVCGDALRVKVTKAGSPGWLSALKQDEVPCPLCQGPDALVEFLRVEAGAA